MSNNILLSCEVETILKDIVPKCEFDLNVISGFCKVSTLKMLDSLTNQAIKKRLLVRFLPSDISSGATDKEIYTYCKNHGWKIYVDHTIHAKTYVFDKIKCIIGSANLTSRGLGISHNCNKEASAYFKIDNDSYTKILSLYKDSIELNDELYEYIVSHIDDSEVINYKAFKLKEEKIECLFPEDFPDLNTDIIELYNLRAYKWLVSFLKSKENNSSYFGELTSQIHDVFVKDPRPFRKDIKQHLFDLLNTIKEMQIKEIKVTRPNYSELVELIEGETAD